MLSMQRAMSIKKLLSIKRADILTQKVFLQICVRSEQPAAVSEWGG